MSEHQVRRILRRDLLPYLVSARRLRRQWFYRLHVVFGYATDLIVALSAIGVSTPLIELLKSLSDTQKDLIPKPLLPTALNSVPGWLLYPTVLSLLIWIVLRIAFNREEGQKRAVLAKSCSQLLRQAEADLHKILSKPDPRPDIRSILETIHSPVDRSIQDEVWPWTPFAPDIDDEVANELELLCSRYEDDWTDIAPHELQQRV